MTFKELNLSDKVMAAIESAGYDTPTPIQEAAIPPAIAGEDILGIAQTGTGKTASFVIPMLTKLERGRARARMPRSLILAPTRELAAQVAESFEQLGANHKLTIALLIGGVSFDEQFKKLDRGADILIATPGRLLDHFSRGKILLTGVEILVIDEADRMLDMGFIDDIKKICGLLPPKRQTMFFSATMPDEIQKFTKKFLKSPVKIEIERQSTAASTITQRFIFNNEEDSGKRETFRKMIDGLEIENAIIFCNRKRDVSILLKSMTKHKYSVGALHGDMDQRQRMATLDSFRGGEITYLVASDVAARGLDIPNVGHVFNFDIPIHAEDYVHRIGRTGRAGREGFAASFIGPKDKKNFDAIIELCELTPEWLGDAPEEEDFRKRSRNNKSSTRSQNGRSQNARSQHDKLQKDRNENKSKDRIRNNEDKRPIDRSEKEIKTSTESTDTETNTIEKISTVQTVQDQSSSPKRNEKTNNKEKPRRTSPSESHSEQKKQSRKQSPTRDKQQTTRDKPRQARNKSDEPIIGMGEHIPAFMTRSPKKGKK